MLSAKTAAPERLRDDRALRAADLVVSSAVVMVIIFLYCAASPVLLKRRVEILPARVHAMTQTALSQVSPASGLRVVPRGFVATSPAQPSHEAANERDFVAFFGFVATFLEVIGVAGGVYCIVAGVCEETGTDSGEKVFVALGGLLLFGGLSAPWLISKLLHLVGTTFPPGL